MQQLQRPTPEWKKFFYASMVVSVFSLIAAVISFTMRKVDSTHSGARVSALQRIQKEGVIRCGYAGFPPYTIINPNEADASKRLSGFAVDLVNEIAKRSVPPLRVEWRTMNWDTAKADLSSGKFDVIAEPLYSTVPRATDLGFVEPYSYFGIGLGIVRKDDDRFHKFEDLDRSDITIAVSEGWTTSEYARTWLHKPKFKSIPVGGDAYTQVDDVLVGRSDVALNDSPTIVQYAQAHPDKVKVLFLDKPPAVVPGGLSVRADETELLQFLNTCMRIFKVDGTLAKLTKKWKTYGYAIDETLVPERGLSEYLQGH
jgi:polar amino acid transport system substrate-binding protein